MAGTSAGDSPLKRDEPRGTRRGGAATKKKRRNHEDTKTTKKKEEGMTFLFVSFVSSWFLLFFRAKISCRKNKKLRGEYHGEKPVQSLFPVLPVSPVVHPFVSECFWS